MSLLVIRNWVTVSGMQIFSKLQYSETKKRLTPISFVARYCYCLYFILTYANVSNDPVFVQFQFSCLFVIVFGPKKEIVKHCIVSS